MQYFRLCLLSSQGLADNTVIAKVNNSVWDLDRPLEEDCSLQLLKFDDEEAQAVSGPSSSCDLWTLIFSPHICKWSWNDQFCYWISCGWVVCVHISSPIPRCTGTQVPTSWEKPWRGCMEDAYAMAPPSRTASTMTCSWIASESQWRIDLFVCILFDWKCGFLFPNIVQDGHFNREVCHWCIWQPSFHNYIFIYITILIIFLKKKKDR